VRLLRLIVRVNRVLGVAFCLAIILPLGVMAWEVSMRYGFGAPTIWAHQTATALIAAIFMFGGMLAGQYDEHVGLSAHEALIPASWQPWRRLLVDLVVLGFLAALAYALILQAHRSVLMWETAGLAWRVPIPMIIKVAMAAGATVFAVDLACRIVLRLADGRRRQDG
jgi:C4-dicarboxylate transporter DctQ subunit